MRKASLTSTMTSSTPPKQLLLPSQKSPRLKKMRMRAISSCYSTDSSHSSTSKKN
jgi:hypothetical protein